MYDTVGRGAYGNFEDDSRHYFSMPSAAEVKLAPKCLKGHFARLDPQLGDNQLYAHMIPLERKHKRTSLKQRDVFINVFLSLLKSVHFIKWWRERGRRESLTFIDFG